MSNNESTVSLRLFEVVFFCGHSVNLIMNCNGNNNNQQLIFIFVVEFRTTRSIEQRND